MIEVGGKEFRTLADKFYVNGRQVLRAEVDGSVVYPDPGSGAITQIQLVYVAKAEFDVFQGGSYVVIDWGDGDTTELEPYASYPQKPSHEYDNWESATANIVTVTTYSNPNLSAPEIHINEKFLGLKRNEGINIIQNSKLSSYLWYRQNNPDFWETMVKSYGGCCFGQWYSMLGVAELYPTYWIEDPWDVSPTAMIAPTHRHERLYYHYACDMEKLAVQRVDDA